MKRLLQIFVLVNLILVVTNINAQDQVAKEILAQAAKGNFDKENIASANWTDIKGKFTAVKMAKGENQDLQNGFYAGILELDVKGDFGKLKSGKFNLFFKSDNQNLNLYLEEKGKINSILEAMTKAPEGLKDAKSSSKPELAFLETSVDDKLSFNFLSKFNFISSFNSTFISRKRCKIWMKITVGGRGYWVWSGFYKQCRGSAT